MYKPLALAAAAVLSLAGCASNGKIPVETASSTAETTTTTASEPPTETPSPTPTPTATVTPKLKPAALTYSCSINGEDQDFSNFREVWATKAAVEFCLVEFVPGYEYDPRTPVEQQALTVAYGKAAEPDSVKSLYAICAQTSGIPIDRLISGDQAKEASGAIVLCPDHPKMGLIKKGIAFGLAEAKNEAAIEVDRKNGKFLGPGSYLVGKEAVPGTWQSQGEKVTECYWEISDAAGNIMANNFINIAPQFSITVPGNAAGITISGCSFRWIGP